MGRGNPDITKIGQKTRFSGKRAAEAALKSAEAKRKSRPLKLALKGIATEAMYNPAPLTDEQKAPVAEFFDVSIEDVTMAHLALYKQAIQSAKGNLQSLIFMRDMVGEKPTQNVNITSADFSELDAVTWR